MIEDLDFVNRLERFGQAADGAPPLRNQKFADSPLEGGVRCELVSEFLESIKRGRTETDEAFSRFFAKTDEADRKVADRVAEVAKARGVARAQIALAWLLTKPVITAPIVGATKLHHLDDAIASVDVKLSAVEVAALEAPYIRHAVVGFE